MKLLLAILSRDLRAEWRRRETVTTIVLFAMLTVLTFVFAFDPARHAREEILPGTLWTAFFFAGILGLNRSAAKDDADGGLVGIVLSPADRGLIYLGKLISNTVFMAVGELVVLLLVILWFDLDGRHLTPTFFLLLVLGTLGFLAIGTVFAVIGQKTRLREVMLPVLLLPVLTPLVQSLVEAMALVLVGNDGPDLSEWLRLVVAYDVLYITCGFLLYGFVLED